MEDQYPLPPKLPDRILGWFIKGDLLEEILGDLYEYNTELGDLPNWKRKLYYTYHAFHFLRPFALKKLEGQYRLNNYGMLKNYFKVGIRNILKYKMFSFINVFGLAVAMSVCMLIILMLADQKSYDQFHEHKEQVYRILGTPELGSVPYATVPQPISSTLKDEYPMLDEAIVLRNGLGGDATYQEKNIELRGFFTDNAFFDVFSFQLVKGDKKTVLSEPNSIVITEDKAYQLFKDENPIGKFVKFEDRGLSILDIEGDKPPVDWGLFNVVGVVKMEDIKSHLKFDALVSSATLQNLYQDSLIADVSDHWESYWSAYVYVKLKTETDPIVLDKALADISGRKYADSEELSDYMFSSQPLTEITPGMVINNEATFRLPQIAYYILSLLALVIMTMACLNFTNLSVARSISRMKEIGVRKVTGATRSNIAFQFLTESLITSFIALLVAVILLFFTKEAFMGLWINEYLNFDLNTSLPVFGSFVLFALIIGLIAGIYPAIFISLKSPVNALKSNLGTKSKRWNLQKVLNVSQFVVSLLFIVTSLVIYNQFNHYTTFEYGFNAERVLNIPLQSNDYQTTANEIAGVSGVITVSACDNVPATGTTNMMSIKNVENEEEPYTSLTLNIDKEFLSNLDLKVTAGNNFSATTSKNQVLINEMLVSKLGYESAQDAIGETITSDRSGTSMQVIGVVEDFRATLLINGDEVRPLVLFNDLEDFSVLNVRIADGNPTEVIGRLEATWKSIDPAHEFKYEFFEDELSNTNLAVFDLVTIVGYIAFLAILIACLGLLGMATYTTERKTKEVGVRKVLGASEAAIVLILSKGFLKLLSIAIIIAAPLSYFVNNLWLENLPNRVDFGFGTVLFGSILMLLLGILTIGSQTIRAARLNPVDSLQDE